MDFNLDGDFGKLSSFNVDMDFDFSVPSKKAAKQKERSEDEFTTGSHQGKKDQFNFSFDFNEYVFILLIGWICGFSLELGTYNEVKI